MVGSMDDPCTHIVSMRGRVMGTVAGTMEGNQLCTSPGIKVASDKVIRTSDQRFKLIGVLE